MTAVIYARYSTDSQREESIEGQIRECTAYAEKNGFTVVKHYIDRAVSAKTDNRPQFQQMIKDSERGIFDVIIVWKLDRFARNRYDSARYKTQLKRNGVKLVSATEVISAGPEGIILESVLEGYAEYYSADLSEKVVRGMTENALKGIYNGGTIPFGYMIDETRHYQPDPLLAPYVEQTFQKYADGATMTDLRDWLKAHNIKNSMGGEMSYNTIQRMLSNRRYIGELRLRDVVQPNAIPALVSEELFNKVQEKLAKNKKAPARHKAEESYLLTTKLYCGKCGALMFGESGVSHTGKMYTYYKCAAAKKKKTCDKKAVRKQWLEDLVINETMKLVEDDASMNAIIAKVMELQNQESTDLPIDEKQLKETEVGITNMLNAIQMGILTSSTKERLEALEEQRKELQARIAEERLAKPKMKEEFVRFWLLRFRKLDMTQPEQRQALVDTFINAIYLYDDKVLITFNYKEGTETVAFGEAVKAEKSSDMSARGAPWRVFLQHLKSCKNTRFLYSEFTGGVVDDYAFSCIYGHFRDRQGQHRWNLDRSDAVIVDAKPLLPYTVDLLSIEHFDLLNQFVQHPGRQFSRSGVLTDKTDKHICRHGTAALLLYFGAELFYFLCQFLLLVLIPPGHFCEAVIGELAGNIILIDALKKAVQFFITGKERS